MDLFVKIASFDTCRLVDITYEESLEHVENPDRGFMATAVSRASDPNPLTASCKSFCIVQLTNSIYQDVKLMVKERKRSR